MDKHHLRTVFTLLLAASLSACSGGAAGNLLTSHGFGDSHIPATNARAVNAAAARIEAGLSSIAINSGGGAAPGNWIADTGYAAVGWSGVADISRSIDMGRVANPAPAVVYTTQRYAPHLVYAIPSLVPNATYNVRLHFAELFWNQIGKRIFDVGINNTQVLSNFDIFKSAGGANIAIAPSFTSTADGAGQITVKLDASRDNASIAGIEVAVAAHQGATSPTPAPTTAPFSVGPRMPVGPQAATTCPPSSVQLLPGTNVQSVVNAHAPGMTYCFSAAVYAQQEVTPNTGDTYIGVKGAILDGKNTTVHAFYGSASGVTIRNLVIRNYKTPLQDGPINNRWYKGVNWTIENNEVANNSGGGVQIDDGTSLVANYIHGNGQTGYHCSGVNVVISDNEIADNNPNDAVDPSYEAGGGKCMSTTNLTAEHNYVHDNHGPGLWTDTDNQGTVYAYNDVEDNWYGGIFHEISWDATISNNVLKNNGNTKYCPSLSFWCSNIMIANSGGANGKSVDIFGNTVVANRQSHTNGITLMNEDRGSGLYGTFIVRNVHVHNNKIDLSAGGVTGAITYNGDSALFSSQGNSFSGDAYTGAGSNAFYWNGAAGAFSFFQSQGQETNGSSR